MTDAHNYSIVHLTILYYGISATNAESLLIQL